MLTVIFIVLFIITLLLYFWEHVKLLATVYAYVEKEAPEISEEEYAECLKKVLKHLIKRD